MTRFDSPSQSKSSAAQAFIAEQAFNSESALEAAPKVPPWSPLRGPMQRWPRLFDGAFALLSFVLTIGMWRPSLGGASLAESVTGASAVLFALIGNAAVYWRRLRPLEAHGVIVATSALALGIGMGSGVFGMAFSLYSLGRYTESKRASLVGLCAAAALSAVQLFVPTPPSVGSVVTFLIVMGLWYLGKRLRFRSEYLRLLEERARHLERHRMVEAKQAVEKERNRIARELHDIVAHQVSLMTVQAGAAKTVALEAPELAREAMEAVEHAGRRALGELRHLLGVLRPGHTDERLDPQPGVKDVPRLVDEVKKAGLEVTLSLEGDPSTLPARVDLALYRLTQESLTNVLKHAGDGADAHVEIRLGGEGACLTVMDSGRARASLPSSGHGIVGMRERVELLGGRFSAGADLGKGFCVRAFVPLKGAES